MTRDDIIRMAQESGLVDRVNLGSEAGIELSLRKMQAFAALVAAAEREACVQIVHKRTGIPEDATRRGTGVRDQLVVAGEQIIEAIRARGAPPQRCAACGYQYGHAIGCVNNPVDIALSARSTT